MCCNDACRFNGLPTTHADVPTQLILYAIVSFVLLDIVEYINNVLCVHIQESHHTRLGDSFRSLLILNN